MSRAAQGAYPVPVGHAQARSHKDRVSPCQRRRAVGAHFLAGAAPAPAPARVWWPSRPRRPRSA